jgi:hypothetical protein
MNGLRRELGVKPLGQRRRPAMFSTYLKSSTFSFPHNILKNMMMQSSLTPFNLGFTSSSWTSRTSFSPSWFPFVI